MKVLPVIVQINNYTMYWTYTNIKKNVVSKKYNVIYNLVTHYVCIAAV